MKKSKEKSASCWFLIRYKYTYYKYTYYRTSTHIIYRGELDKCVQSFGEET